MKDLLFLTDCFPFDYSEAFIENEIEYICNCYNRVFIIPTALNVNMKNIREIPSNAIVLSPKSRKRNNTDKEYFFYILIWLFPCLLSGYFYKELRRIKRDGKKMPGAVAKLLFELGKAKRNKRTYRKQLKQYRVLNADIYSYWLTPSILFSKEYVPNYSGTLVSRAHRFEIYEEESRFGYIPLQEEIIKMVDRIFCISLDGKKYLQNRFNDNCDKILLSYLGTKDYGLGPYSENSKIFTIVSCSYIVPVKRVDLIFDIICQVYPIFTKDIRWIHFGDGPLANSIREKIEHSNIGTQCVQLKGQVTNQELIDYYRTHQVDLFINMSESEGLPVSIMEAISFGIPVVATDVGGTREIVYEGENGWLVSRQSSVDDVIKKLLTISEDNDQMSMMRKKARMIWEEKFNATHNYSSLFQKIEQ